MCSGGAFDGRIALIPLNLSSSVILKQRPKIRDSPDLATFSKRVWNTLSLQSRVFLTCTVFLEVWALFVAIAVLWKFCAPCIVRGCRIRRETRNVRCFFPISLALRCWRVFFCLVDNSRVHSSFCLCHCTQPTRRLRQVTGSAVCSVSSVFSLVDVLRRAAHISHTRTFSRV